MILHFDGVNGKEAIDHICNCLDGIEGGREREGRGGVIPSHSNSFLVHRPITSFHAQTFDDQMERRHKVCIIIIRVLDQSIPSLSHSNHLEKVICYPITLMIM